MGKLIRFYNQNRKSIWIFILIIFFLFLMLQLINYFVGRNQQNQILSQQNTSKSEINNSNSNIGISSTQSVVSREDVNTETLQTAQDMIEKFLVACSDKRFEEAYDLLTEECKEEMYSSLDFFINSYASKIFNGQKINCNIENWVDNTYKVDIKGDILSTGKVNQNESIQDYITLKREEDSYKLNINRYIGRHEIKRTNTKDNVKIEVLTKDTYMDYEKYTINIANNSESDILLDTKQDMKSMYIQDDHEVKYSSYSHELTNADLTIYKNSTRTIAIKYYSSYNSDKDIEKLVFSNVIMDYNVNSGITNSTKVQEIDVNL